MQVQINEKQVQTLTKVIAAGKIDVAELDSRSVKALASRGLVKLSENKKGTFVTPTAKGKKLN